MGKIFVITGPSGSGKTTIIRHFFAANNPKTINLFFSVSCTSRPKRKFEVEGEDYYFISKNEFKKRIKLNEFVEYVTFDNHYYGTSVNFLMSFLQQNRNVLLDIDIQGALMIKKLFPNDSYLICISALQWVIEKRLRERKSNSEKSINNRMKLYKTNFLNLPKEKFSAIIINEQNNLKSVSKNLVSFLANHKIKNLNTIG